MLSQRFWPFLRFKYLVVEQSTLEGNSWCLSLFSWPGGAYMKGKTWTFSSCCAVSLPSNSSLKGLSVGFTSPRSPWTLPVVSPLAHNISTWSSSRSPSSSWSIQSYKSTDRSGISACWLSSASSSAYFSWKRRVASPTWRRRHYTHLRAVPRSKSRSLRCSRNKLSNKRMMKNSKEKVLIKFGMRHENIDFSEK